MLFAIVDIETTGGIAPEEKIIEIGIVIHDGQKIIQTFSSLINPDRAIPPFITRLTGITNEMVRDAPRFYEIAKQIVELTEGKVFVAHNVSFDYGFVREEFNRLGYRYMRKQLCTVRLSRKVIPNLSHYNLDALIKHLNIKIDPKDRHRALGDALATTELFSYILREQSAIEEIENIVNEGINESKLPANISLELLHSLPEETGIYFFYNQTGDVIYVGKSKNIRKRVLEHFAARDNKETRLQRAVCDISYEKTGSELAALLLESYQIKHLQPVYNRAQKQFLCPYAMYAYHDEQGILSFALKTQDTKTPTDWEFQSEYIKIQDAQLHLRKITKRFDLCYHHVEMGTLANRDSFCFGYHIGQCKGVCGKLETVADYNLRAAEAKNFLGRALHENMVIVDSGRNKNEKTVVLLENNRYKGFGYIDVDDAHSIREIRNAVQPYPHNPDAIRIIQGFLKKPPRNMRIVKF